MFTVIYHSLLIGAALFVPIPFLDDRLATFLWKHMVSDLAKSHNKTLTEAQLLALSYQSRFALSDGCMFVIRRFFKELLQEILFFLEWSKAINLAADAYSPVICWLLPMWVRPAKVRQYAVARKKTGQRNDARRFRATFDLTDVLMSIVKWLSSITVGYVKTRGLEEKPKIPWYIQQQWRTFSRCINPDFRNCSRI
jgi:hypothetical protein